MTGWWKTSKLNPNCWRLVRYVRPIRLQTWCAHHGVLTGRWTQDEIDAVNRKATRDAEEFQQYVGTCQGADFSQVAHALGQGLIDHADRDGLRGVQRAVFMDRGAHAPGEACPSAPPAEPQHDYWCQYPNDECNCPAVRLWNGDPR